MMLIRILLITFTALFVTSCASKVIVKDCKDLGSGIYECEEL